MYFERRSSIDSAVKFIKCKRIRVINIVRNLSLAHFELVMTFIFCEVNQTGRLKSGNFDIENIDDDIKLFMSTV